MVCNMLKNKILLLVLLLFSFPFAWGQRTDVREEVYANPQRSYGNDFPYPAQTCRPTPPPSGYKPFYISHYGRHGSRYYWESSLYARMDSLLTAAHDRGILTEAGESFYRQFSSILPELTVGVTELTPLGYEQHVRVAKTMYDSFPEIFRKGGRVEAFSSLEGRCIVSMAAFPGRRSTPWSRTRRRIPGAGPSIRSRSPWRASLPSPPAPPCGGGRSWRCSSRTRR